MSFLFDAAAVVHSLAVSPQGDLLALGGEDGSVQIFHLVHGRKVFDSRVCVEEKHLGRVQVVNWSYDGAFLVSGDRLGILKVWNLADGDCLTTYRGHRHSICAAIWHPESYQIASGGRDRSVQIWDACSANRLEVYCGHRRDVSCIAWSHEGDMLASGDRAGMVHLWHGSRAELEILYDGHCKELQPFLQEHMRGITGIAFAPDDTHIATTHTTSGELSGRLHLWEGATGKRFLRYPKSALGCGWQLQGLRWTEEREVLAATADGRVFVLDYEGQKAHLLLSGLPVGEALGFLSDGSGVVSTSSFDACIRMHAFPSFSVFH